MNSINRNQAQVVDEVIETRVVGVTFEGRQAVLAKLRVGEKIWLRREPGNAYDRNAIRVERDNGEQIGYLDRYLARRLAYPLDEVGGLTPGCVSLVLGGYAPYASLGVRIQFSLPIHT